jgi:hypothetical protein
MNNPVEYLSSSGSHVALEFDDDPVEYLSSMMILLLFSQFSRSSSARLDVRKSESMFD